MVFKTIKGWMVGGLSLFRNYSEPIQLWDNPLEMDDYKFHQ